MQYFQLPIQPSPGFEECVDIKKGGQAPTLGEAYFGVRTRQLYFTKLFKNVGTSVLGQKSAKGM